MAGNVGPVRDERDGLLSFLAQQRHVLRVTAYGLSDEQARLAPTESSLSVGGLIKHVAHTEQGWLDTVLQRERPGGGQAAYVENFRLAEDETLAGVLEFYERVAAETVEIIDGIADLDQRVPAPDAPWFQGVDAWSVRWVLLHLIQETARHAGHADIVREHVDGATGYELLAAAEGWPASDWITPWSPKKEAAV